MNKYEKLARKIYHRRKEDWFFLCHELNKDDELLKLFKPHNFNPIWDVWFCKHYLGFNDPESTNTVRVTALLFMSEMYKDKQSPL